MNKEQSRIGPSMIQLQNLKLIYGYYCKLNTKIKHKHFDDVSQKSSKMNLHQFMTFCKDFGFIAVHKKNNNRNIVISSIDHVQQNMSAVSEKPSIIDGTSNQKIAPIVKIQAQIQRSQLTNKESNTVVIETQPMKENIDLNQMKKQKQIQRKSPLVYCKERKLAELFKRYIDCEGQTNFQFFCKILEKVAQQMFPSSKQHIDTKQTTDLNPITIEREQIFSNQKGRQISPFTQLMKYLRIETKEDTLRTYQTINEIHKTFEHLTMMRLPIKRLNLRNDPTIKINQIEELKHSKIHNIQNRLPKKTDMNKAKFPKLPKKLQKQNGNVHSYSKKVKHFQLLGFIQQNKQKIEILNNSYLQNSIRCNVIKQKILKKSRMAQYSNSIKIQTNPSILHYSKNGVYKNKQIVDLQRKQIGQLFDITSLYDDDIFNKYIEMNYNNNDKTYQEDNWNAREYLDFI